MLLQFFDDSLNHRKTAAKLEGIVNKLIRFKNEHRQAQGRSDSGRMLLAAINVTVLLAHVRLRVAPLRPAMCDGTSGPGDGDFYYDEADCARATIDVIKLLTTLHH